MRELQIEMTAKHPCLEQILSLYKIILEMNPNKHDVKILKKFAMDRLFQRILHMKRQMKQYQLENGQKKSTRAKKIVIDLGET